MSNTPEKKALITGGGGFAGSHLSTLRVSKGWEGTLFDSGGGRARERGRGVRFVDGDIRSTQALVDALSKARPAVVFHLAAIAFVPAAEKNREEALAVNVSGALNLFEAARETVPEARLVVISSSEVYGRSAGDGKPLREEAPVRPATFYAFTKAALESAAFYAASTGLDVVVLRPFNHIAPGQSDLYVASAFARQVAEAECGKVEPLIRVGNLEAERNFTDVEDMVEAYRLAGTAPLKDNLYNLCSSTGFRIRKLLDILLSMARTPIRIEVDPERLRPSDTPVIIGSCSRFCKETGWRTTVSLDESLRRILDYWRSRCS